MIKRIRHHLWLATVLTFAVSAFSQSLVCRKPGINGRDANAVRAHKFLPPNTSDVSKVAIYVENTQDGLYFHSNYVTPGFDNPTKVLTKDTSDLELVFRNIVFAEEADADERQTAMEAYADTVQIFLDQKYVY